MSGNEKIETLFAPAERADEAELIRQSNSLSGFRLMFEMLDAIPNGLVILNQNRQIVYSNQMFQETAVPNDAESLIGLRPGEALNCIHWRQMPGGCGTIEVCQTCGVIKVIIKAQRGQKNVQECRITRTAVDDTVESLDLRIWATPFRFASEEFTVFAAIDIGDEKRRQVLERLFFHDIGNTAGDIQGLAELVEMTDSMAELNQFDFRNLLSRASHQLVDEIAAQRQLIAAERGELSPQWEPMDAINVLEEVMQLYKNHPIAEDCLIRIDPKSKPATLITDRALLKRVIGNLVKNGLEASQTGEVVTVGCDPYSDQVRFWVHNPAFMPRHIQLQIFQRSFSTKGRDRGLGTYSIKLLTEQYLQGVASFRSDQEKGTIFVVMYPKRPEGGSG